MKDFDYFNFGFCYFALCFNKGYIFLTIKLICLQSIWNTVDSLPSQYFPLANHFPTRKHSKNIVLYKLTIYFIFKITDSVGFKSIQRRSIKTTFESFQFVFFFTRKTNLNQKKQRWVQQISTWVCLHVLLQGKFSEIFFSF